VARCSSSPCRHARLLVGGVAGRRGHPAANPARTGTGGQGGRRASCGSGCGGSVRGVTPTRFLDTRTGPVGGTVDRPPGRGRGAGAGERGECGAAQPCSTGTTATTATACRRTASPPTRLRLVGVRPTRQPPRGLTHITRALAGWPHVGRPQALGAVSFPRGVQGGRHHVVSHHVGTMGRAVGRFTAGSCAVVDATVEAMARCRS
jgi:hypothetical protein